MAKQDLIGQDVLINLPEITEQMVKARVDTGAQTSAIWASSVVEDEEGLHITFLGPKGDYKVSPKITFTEYTKVKVASSNSLSEERYKVKLLVVVNNRQIRAWFTLTDRSKRSYPVLLGRNVLHRKFIVDVSHKPKAKEA